MREALTPPYAAPEQWRGERPSKATDVYALGCIAHTLLRGAPPFAGPNNADYSHQHQFVAAPGLNATPHLKRLTASCLSKAPELRPSISSLRKQLATALVAISSSRAHQLAAAGAAVLEREAQEEEQRLQRVREKTRRQQIATEAAEQLKAMFEELEAAVLRDAPNATVGTTFGLRVLRLGGAALEYGIPFPEIESGLYPQSGNGYQIGSPRWDLFAGGFLRIRTTKGPERGQSANLWFGRLLEGDDYKWWEVSYVYPRGTDPDARFMPEPFGMDTHLSAYYSLARDPEPITSESQDAFLDRWIDLFGQFASTDYSRIASLFPKHFKRQKVSPQFKPDRR
jgi:eukaryotic-like serine/threonine-protein kinase